MDSRYLWKEEQKIQEVHENQNNNIIMDENQISDEKQEQATGYELKNKREEVKKRMPDGIDVFREKQNLVRNGRYRYLDSKGRPHDAERLTPSSKYMKPVLDALNIVDTKLNGRFDPTALEDVRKSFIDAIIACENYIDNRNPWTAEGKARLRMVKDFYAQLKQESMQLAEWADEIKNPGNKIQGEMTWSDILRQVRTDEYNDTEKNVNISKGGDGTSEIYIIEHNGMKSFFKEKEEIEVAGFSKLIDKSKKNLKKNTEEYAKGAHSENEIESLRERNRQRSELIDGMVNIIKKAFGISDGNMLDFLRSEPINVILKAIFKKAKKSKFKEAFDLAYEEHKAMKTELQELENRLRNLPENDPDRTQYEKNIEMKKKEILSKSNVVFLGNELEAIKRKLLLPKIAVDTAKIKMGDELSKRNVATSRIAKLLGLEDIVAKSKLSNVIVDGKSMTGIMMEEAKGKQAYEINEDNEEKQIPFRYTSDSFRELLSLQVFDLICGQTDRHTKNYMVQVQAQKGTNIVKGIKAIDNDMAFGRIHYSDIKKLGLIGYGAMKNIEIDGEMSIPFMDHKLAMNIMAMDPDIINYQMTDILSKDERKALISRIKGVKKVINKQLTHEAELKRKNKKYVSRFVKGREDAKDSDKAWQKAWDEAYDSYKKHIAALDKKNKKNIELTGNYVKNTTYLLRQGI